MHKEVQFLQELYGETMTTSKKMEIWDQVAKTDPRHTKKVNQRGGFTAIDAHYQVMRATEVFGPVGKGWSYQVIHSVVEAGNIVLAMADVTVRWRNGSNTWHEFGPIRGCSPLVNEKGRLDDDAPKKATTDALTKALSHLGFSADVFLGMYDDNKYMQQVTAEFKMKAQQAEADTKDADTKWANDLVKKINALDSVEGLDELRNANVAMFKAVEARNKATAMRVSSAMANRRSKLVKEETANG